MCSLHFVGVSGYAYTCICICMHLINYRSLNKSKETTYPGHFPKWGGGKDRAADDTVSSAASRSELPPPLPPSKPGSSGSLGGALTLLWRHAAIWQLPPLLSATPLTWWAQLVTQTVLQNRAELSRGISGGGSGCWASALQFYWHLLRYSTELEYLLERLAVV